MKWQPIFHWSEIIYPERGTKMHKTLLDRMDLVRHVVALERPRVALIGHVNLELTEEVFLK